MTFLLGPLTAAMIGDAYGCGFEFLPNACIGESNNGTTYFQHTMEPRMAAGCYSDDVQRLLANVGALARGRLTDPAAYEYELCYQARFSPRGGSPRMLAAYRKAQETGRPLAECLGEKTDSAGACMGASVFGLMESLDEARQAARVQASFTHSSDGEDAAEMVAWMAWVMHRGLEPEHVRGRLREVFPQHANMLYPTKKRVMNKALDCVNGALTALERATSLRDVLVQCVAIGGDTDTLATIAMGCAWNCQQLPNDLPDSLWEGLNADDRKAVVAWERELVFLASYPFLVHWTPRRNES